MSSAKDRGNNHYRNSQYGAAIEEFSTAIDAAANGDSELHFLHSNRCACYLQLNKVNCALQDAYACTRLKPGWAKGYSRLGGCFLRLNRPAEAIAALEKGLELEPFNTEISNALNQARQQQHGGQGRGSNDGNAGAGGHQSTGNNGNSGDMLSSVKRVASQALARALQWWSGVSDDNKKYIGIGAVCLAGYYLFFSGRSSNGYDSGGYDSGSGYGSGYGYSSGYGGGMSWTMWGAIMFGAYKVPPMFPDVFGDYAKPFFGMNWTTFMWLLNMVTQNRRGMGGGMGFNRGFGGMGRRRY